MSSTKVHSLFLLRGMATLRRNHTPVPWGAHVERMVWARSRSGAPRRRRSDRPPLTHEPGWDWDGKRISFCEGSAVPDREERDCEVCGFQHWEDDHAPISSERTHASLSLFDIARSQPTKRRSKARSGVDDFEVVRIPRVVPVPVSEGESDLADSWKLSEWEKLDALSFKRTYSEVARGFVDGEDPPNAPNYSRLTPSEEDLWEYL